MYDFESITNAEYYRATGTLTERRIEGLIDMEEAVGSGAIKELSAALDDLDRWSVPEDFLNPLSDALHDAMGGTRGKTRDKLQHALAILDDLAQLHHDGMDSHHGKIRKAALIAKRLIA